MVLLRPGSTPETEAGHPRQLPLGYYTRYGFFFGSEGRHIFSARFTVPSKVDGQVSFPLQTCVQCQPPGCRCSTLTLNCSSRYPWRSPKERSSVQISRSQSSAWSGLEGFQSTTTPASAMARSFRKSGRDSTPRGPTAAERPGPAARVADRGGGEREGRDRPPDAPAGQGEALRRIVGLPLRCMGRNALSRRPRL